MFKSKYTFNRLCESSKKKAISEIMNQYENINSYVSLKEKQIQKILKKIGLANDSHLKKILDYNGKISVYLDRDTLESIMIRNMVPEDYKMFKALERISDIRISFDASRELQPFRLYGHVKEIPLMRNEYHDLKNRIMFITNYDKRNEIKNEYLFFTLFFDTTDVEMRLTKIESVMKLNDDTNTVVKNGIYYLETVINTQLRESAQKLFQLINEIRDIKLQEEYIREQLTTEKSTTLRFYKDGTIVKKDMLNVLKKILFQ